jgi:8-oxo-dGTP pyrophosphatase MutT (NUDIX family)
MTDAQKAQGNPKGVGGIRDRIRGLEDGSITPPPTRDASTVVLLRDGRNGLEAYLLRRASTMSFGPGMHVFPGGSVDPDDAATEIGWVGPDPDQYATVLTADIPLARALVCAAVRETFEESGVLLAGGGEDDIVDVSADEWEDERSALEGRQQSLASMLNRRSLVLRADLLRPWAHWITPVVESKRFDTRFFVAATPEGQTPRLVGGEADRRLWLRPQDALARHADGELGMLPPTAFTLSELTEYATVADVLAAAAARDVKPVLPKLILTGEQVEFVLPEGKLLPPGPRGVGSV